ncbi:MAG: CBS domain-containing protein [Candidatus Bathyarchaeota archaeon]|nr:CBS domain-containing protein [Candidatus Bathyarchaeota archaeon]
MRPEVRHFMNRDPVTITSDYTVRDTAQMMIDFGLETLIVTEDDEILGAVTYRDLLEYLMYPTFNPDTVTVGEITDEEITLVRPTTSLSDCAEIMLETDKAALPVVDSELRGYISYTDILKLVYRISNVEADEVEPEAKPFDTGYYII